MKWEDAKRELLKDKRLKKAYHKRDLKYSLQKAWTNFKIRLKGLL